MSTLHRMTAISAITIWAQAQSKLKQDCAGSAQHAPYPHLWNFKFVAIYSQQRRYEFFYAFAVYIMAI